MRAPLSHNEFEILDHQAETINNQLAEIANLLETRLGDTTDLATSARTIQQDFAALAHKIHREAARNGAIPPAMAYGVSLSEKGAA